MQNHHLTRLIVFAALIVLLLTSCTASQILVDNNSNSPGFWLGLWHGFIAPIVFFISLFPNDLRIYTFPNAGIWYDFGFMLGISGFSGGVFAGSRKKEES